MYEKGEIILIPFPYSDLTGSKLRPALIISNSKLQKTEDRICCLITSNNPREGILVSNKAQQEGKLPFESWVKPHRIFTVNIKIIKKTLCQTTPDFQEIILKEMIKYVN
jgi:mRNA interferase MazF